MLNEFPRIRGHRRDFLKLGALGGLSLSLGDYLRLAAANELSSQRTAESAIFIWLAGGPSHIDSFDMKPEAPAERRGEFKPIGTNVPGIQICEHLPKVARVCDQFTILRGVSHNLGDHALGTSYVVSGNRPSAQSNYPGLGALVTKYRKTRDPELPQFIAIPESPQTGGYLGLAYSPLPTRGTPTPGRQFNLRGVSLAKGQSLDKFKRSEALRRSLDVGLVTAGVDDPLLHSMDEFSDQALQIIASTKTRDALDISREKPAVASSFGKSDFGLSCLAAVRLIESGVRFVTVNMRDWDTHLNNCKVMKENLLPRFDEGFAAMMMALNERGLLDKTAVIVTGEFGRTPSMEINAGRGHHPQAMFVLMAGAGIPGGRVLGGTDKLAAAPVDFECTPADVAASYLTCLGVDPQIEYQTNNGRPVKLISDGKLIPDLFS